MSLVKNLATRMPVLYLSHGGGPSFFLESSDFPRFRDISKDSPAYKGLQELPIQLGLTTTHIPKAIVLISAHWETSDAVHISGRDTYDSLFYDYYGFPPETYKIQYNAPGNSSVSKQVQHLLSEAGIKAQLDTKRNFDHGVFVPLKVMFPKADIPIVEMSILQNYDPEQHIKMGKALAPLRDEGILIIGSGFITHNFGGNKANNLEFVDALAEKLTTASPEERLKVLTNWTNLPSARKAHAQEDHFVPMFTAAGAAYEATSVKEVSRTLVDSGRMIFSHYIFN